MQINVLEKDPVTVQMGKVGAAGRTSVKLEVRRHAQSAPLVRAVNPQLASKLSALTNTTPTAFANAVHNVSFTEIVVTTLCSALKFQTSFTPCWELVETLTIV